MKIYMLSFVFGSLAKLNSAKKRLKGSPFFFHISSLWSLSLASFAKEHFTYSDSDTCVKPFYLDFEKWEEFHKSFLETKIDF
ncbi:MAG: hypothetical protein MJZ00_05250 [Paludibacteraceae bacterium]|nr:hypothetical protein [Paludibacteraceae bacterium]